MNLESTKRWASEDICEGFSWIILTDVTISQVYRDPREVFAFCLFQFKLYWWAHLPCSQLIGEFIYWVATAASAVTILQWHKLSFFDLPTWRPVALQEFSSTKLGLLRHLAFWIEQLLDSRPLQCAVNFEEPSAYCVSQSNKPPFRIYPFYQFCSSREPWYTTGEMPRLVKHIYWMSVRSFPEMTSRGTEGKGQPWIVGDTTE